MYLFLQFLRFLEIFRNSRTFLVGRKKFVEEKIFETVPIFFDDEYCLAKRRTVYICIHFCWKKCVIYSSFDIFINLKNCICDYSRLSVGFSPKGMYVKLIEIYQTRNFANAGETNMYARTHCLDAKRQLSLQRSCMFSNKLTFIQQPLNRNLNYETSTTEITVSKKIKDLYLYKLFTNVSYIKRIQHHV